MERGESAETVWAWARRYVASASLAEKIALAPPPPTWGPAPAPDLRLRPGRPPELVVIPRVERPRSPRTVHGVAQLLHTFWHRELQAAELLF
ncbi:MAG: hypothetical protein KC417_01010 [Myxococcales bacterium]|nr:hypothetical protein [Myxococcales bacterium]